MNVIGTYLGAFLLLLGVLVFFHELGHFLAAKLCRVKVERFSLGFGGAILQRTIGETEYRVSWLPLGGYVKMLGEVPGEALPEEEIARSFSGQSLPRRVVIALAGPAMNLVLPILMVAGMVMSGIPEPTTRIGGVRPGSPAARAGLLPGDRILAVDGKPVEFFQDLQDAVEGSAGALLQLTVERRGARFDSGIAPESEPGSGRLVLGLEHSTASAVLGVPDPESTAARAGLRTGDRVTAIGGSPVRDWYGLVAALEAARGPLEMEVARGLEGREEHVRLTVPGAGAPWSLERLGAVQIDFAVAHVAPGTPARRAGLRVGDIPLRLDGEPIHGYAQLIRMIRGSGGRALHLDLLRGGREVGVEITPRLAPVETEEGVEDVLQIGIIGYPPQIPGEVREHVIRNPFRAVWIGVERTGDILAVTLDGIWKLASGKVGLRNLAGPIGIGKFAGDYFQEEGWAPFLNLLAVISVNLAILNLLPIPVLDGGHILLAVAEVIQGSPISLRTREIAQTGGLVFIVLLMGFAFWNDITRHWTDFLGFFQGVP